MTVGSETREIADTTVKVLWAEVAALASEPNAADPLTLPERCRYDKAEPAAARSFLAGRVLLRRLVATLTGEDQASVVIEATCADCGGPHGRPVVIGPGSALGLQISLAHDGDSVFAAAAWHRAVGIDAEATDAGVPDSTASIEAVAVAGGASNGDALLHWTRIEAVLKADGRGLRVDPRGIAIEELPEGVATAGTELVTATVPDDERRYLITEIAVDASVRVSVAIER